jgi:hypothetical protein
MIGIVGSLNYFIIIVSVEPIVNNILISPIMP